LTKCFLHSAPSETYAVIDTNQTRKSTAEISDNYSSNPSVNYAEHTPDKMLLPQENTYEVSTDLAL